MCDCGLSKNLVKPNLGLANEDIETSLGVPSILKSESFADSLWTPPPTFYLVKLKLSFSFDGTPKQLQQYKHTSVNKEQKIVFTKITRMVEILNQI